MVRCITAFLVIATAASATSLDGNCPSNVHPYSVDKQGSDWIFNRIATFPVCQLLHPTCNTSATVVSEIVAVSSNGQLLAFTDGAGARGIGLVDITDPHHPVGMGFVGGGANIGATSVKFMGNKWALVSVDTSPNFTNPSGYLDIIDVEANPPASYHKIDLGTL